MATLATLMPRRRFGVTVNAHAIVCEADELIVMAARTQLLSHIGGRRNGGGRGRGKNPDLRRRWVSRRGCGGGSRGSGSCRSRSGSGARPGLFILRISLATGV